jgi:hypothetical protein
MQRSLVAIVLCGLSVLIGPVRGQEKPKAEASDKTPEAKRDIVPLRVQVVFEEYDGEKKISSLPYTMLVNSNGRPASIRMGLRVPVESGPSQFQYIDLGTNVDCWARDENGRILLHVTAERSSAYSASEVNQKTPLGVRGDVGNKPVIQQFKSDVDLLVRDGQTTQSTLSSDPISGRVSKIEVTASILK